MKSPAGEGGLKPKSRGGEAPLSPDFLFKLIEEHCPLVAPIGLIRRPILRFFGVLHFHFNNIRGQRPRRPYSTGPKQVFKVQIVMDGCVIANL